MAIGALVSCIQEFVSGSYTSAIGLKMVSSNSEPDVTSTRPSAIVVAVGYQRLYAISGPKDQVLVMGSKMFVFAVPGTPVSEQSCPPTTRIRPSGRTVCAEQNRSFVSPSSSWGTGVKTPVVGFQMVAVREPRQ